MLLAIFVHVDIIRRRQPVAWTEEMTTNTKTIAELEEEVQDEIVARDPQFSFTRRELTEAFTLIRPEKHWKGPIDAEFQTGTMPTMSAREVAAVHHAVIFFTRSVPEIRHLCNFRFRVTAAGYFAEIGA
jgi:hypothetical protein